MEPKVKATELVEKFRKYAKIGVDSPVTGRTENAIQCAIICVEEILNEANWWHKTSSYEESTEFEGGEKRVIYWQSVLTELKAMV